MENINEANENSGTIKISDEVLATIASVVVSETNGVYSLAGTIAGDFVSKFGKKNTTKGIKVVTTDENVEIDININVKYGVRIPEISWEIQESVKKSVESMSGLCVSKVNIHVMGVEFEKEDANKAELTEEKENIE